MMLSRCRTWTGECTDHVCMVPTPQAYVPTPRAVIPFPVCKVLSRWPMMLGVTFNPWGWGFPGKGQVSNGAIGVMGFDGLMGPVMSLGTARQGAIWAPSHATDSFRSFLGVQMSFSDIPWQIPNIGLSRKRKKSWKMTHLQSIRGCTV